MILRLHDDDDGRDFVEEMMQANRINPVTHPIMHEYFASEEFHKIWMRDEDEDDYWLDVKTYWLKIKNIV